MTTRRAALASLPALLLACTSVDKLTFDRGAFAITFEKLMTTGLMLVTGAIAKNTKAGVMNEYARILDGYREQLLRVQAEVERQIIEAPSRANQINTDGLRGVVDILARAVPLILPLIVGL